MYTAIANNATTAYAFEGRKHTSENLLRIWSKIQHIIVWIFDIVYELLYTLLKDVPNYPRNNYKLAIYTNERT